MKGKATSALWYGEMDHYLIIIMINCSIYRNIAACY